MWTTLTARFTFSGKKISRQAFYVLIFCEFVPLCDFRSSSSPVFSFVHNTYARLRYWSFFFSSASHRSFWRLSSDIHQKQSEASHLETHGRWRSHSHPTCNRERLEAAGWEEKPQETRGECAKSAKWRRWWQGRLQKAVSALAAHAFSSRLGTLNWGTCLSFRCAHWKCGNWFDPFDIICAI